MQKYTILVIDDDSHIRKLFKFFLEKDNYQIIEACNGKEGIIAFNKQQPDCVIVDLIMPEVDGFEVLKYINKNSPDTPIIVVAGTGTISAPVKALNLGAWDFILKPIEDMTVLLHAVEKSQERASLIKENKIYHEQLEKLVLLKTQELQKVNEDLRSSEERYRSIFENFQDVYFETLIDGTIVDISPSILRLSGYTKEEIIDKNISILHAIISEYESFIKMIHNNKQVLDFEILLLAKNKEKVPCSITAQLRSFNQSKSDKITGTLRNITVRKNNELKIKDQLKEKEILLQEIHHRVKNNMQIINSLIYMQTEFIDDIKVKQSLKQIESRVQSMALVHNQLYQSQNLSKIILKEYINELVSNIQTSFDSNIQYSSDIPFIEISIDSAIPIGLILNEIITNSVKYAFPNNKDNQTLTIRCSHTDKKFIRLTVYDNGIGMVNKINLDNINSLGLTIIDALVLQLNGTYKITNTPGVCFTVNLELP